MKSFLPILALASFLAIPALAQTPLTNAPAGNPPPPGEAQHHDHLSMLTPDEKQELKTDHDAVLKADPDLASQEQDLRDKIKDARDSGDMPDPDVMNQMMILRKKIHDEMVKYDPKVAPILAKVESAYMMHHPGGPGGPGGAQTPPASGGTTNAAPSGT